MSIRRDDTVIVISGVDTGKTGKVIAVSPEEGKVLVSKVHVVKKHAKPRRQGETGGILEVEGAIYADKVALYCPNCKKGVRTHVEIINDKKVRVCSGKGCGHKFD